VSKKNEISPLAALFLAGVGYRAYQQGRNPFFAIIKFIFGFFFLMLGCLFVLGLFAKSAPPSSPPLDTSRFVSPPLVTSRLPGPIALATTPPPPLPSSSSVARVDELGQLLSDTEIVNASGAVIGTVHAGRPVHIVGATSAWLLIRKHDGQEGFIPTASADDVGAWVGSMPERMGSP